MWVNASLKKSGDTKPTFCDHPNLFEHEHKEGKGTHCEVGENIQGEASLKFQLFNTINVL